MFVRRNSSKLKTSSLPFASETGSCWIDLSSLFRKDLDARSQPGDRSPHGHDRSLISFGGWACESLDLFFYPGSQPGTNQEGWVLGIHSKNKRCERLRDQYHRDWWAYTIVRGATGLMIAHRAGKRNGATCTQYFHDSRCYDHQP